MNFFRTIAAAFSMFSSIPMPVIKWDEGSMKYMMCAFPMVGIVSAVLILAWAWISEILGFGTVLYAAGITLLPVAVTGGIHLDGFCDTSDALASHAAPERKREILKDPHTGAFAVISVCAYFILYFALACELERSFENALLLGIGYVLTRTLSGISAICFRVRSGEGLLRTFNENSAKKRAAIVLFIEFAVCAVVMILLFREKGIAAVLAAVLCMAYLKRMSKRQFEGMSGDLAGWFLQTAELLMIAALVAVEGVLSI